MVLSQCYGVIKYTLAFVNLIFWALGLTAVALGVWMLVDRTFMVSVAQEQKNYQAGLYIMLAAGALLVIVSFLGCCGAFRESQCMLVGFFSCLLVIIVAQIAAGAWLYTHRDRIEPLVKVALTATVKDEYGEIDHRTQTVDSIQEGLTCCGANGPNDWASSKYGSKDPNQPISFTVSAPANSYYIPPSCCRKSDPSQKLNYQQESDSCNTSRKVLIGGVIPDEIYSEGCVNKLINELNSKGYIILAIIISLGIVELIGLLLSLVLCCAIGSSDRYKA